MKIIAKNSEPYQINCYENRNTNQLYYLKKTTDREIMLMAITLNLILSIKRTNRADFPPEKKQRLSKQKTGVHLKTLFILH